MLHNTPRLFSDAAKQSRLAHKRWRAADEGDADEVRALAKAGAPIDKPFRGQETPLFAAVNRGCHDVASILLVAGADIC